MSLNLDFLSLSSISYVYLIMTHLISQPLLYSMEYWHITAVRCKRGLSSFSVGPERSMWETVFWLSTVSVWRASRSARPFTCYRWPGRRSHSRSRNRSTVSVQKINQSSFKSNQSNILQLPGPRPQRESRKSAVTTTWDWRNRCTVCVVELSICFCLP